MTPPSTDACVDFEPSGSSAPTDVVIDANVLVHGTDAGAVSISGINGTDPARRVRFTNNTVHGGAIGGVHAQDITVAGNIIIAAERRPIMLFRGTFDGLRVEDNKIVAPEGQLDGIRVAARDGFAASGVRITGNDIETAGVGIALINPGSHVELRGNRIRGRGEAIGIIVQLTGTPADTGPTGEVHRDIQVVGNTITDFADAGIRLSTSNTVKRFEGLEVSANEIGIDAVPRPGPLVGIRFAEPGHGSGRWLQRAIVSENRIADAVEVKIERHGPTVPFFVISGNPDGRAIFEGDGNPNEVGVAAPPGSLFLRVDDETSAALYLKASGSGETGWVEMAKAP